VNARQISLMITRMGNVNHANLSVFNVLMGILVTPVFHLFLLELYQKVVDVLTNSSITELMTTVKIVYPPVLPVPMLQVVMFVLFQFLSEFNHLIVLVLLNGSIVE